MRVNTKNKEMKTHSTYTLHKLEWNKDCNDTTTHQIRMEFGQRRRKNELTGVFCSPHPTVVGDNRDSRTPHTEIPDKLRGFQNGTYHFLVCPMHPGRLQTS